MQRISVSFLVRSGVLRDVPCGGVPLRGASRSFAPEHQAGNLVYNLPTRSVSKMKKKKAFMTFLQGLYIALSPVILYLSDCAELAAPLLVVLLGYAAWGQHTLYRLNCRTVVQMCHDVPRDEYIAYTLDFFNGRRSRVFKLKDVEVEPLEDNTAFDLNYSPQDSATLVRSGDKELHLVDRWFVKDIDGKHRTKERFLRKRREAESLMSRDSDTQ